VTWKRIIYFFDQTTDEAMTASRPVTNNAPARARDISPIVSLSAPEQIGGVKEQSPFYHIHTGDAQVSARLETARLPDLDRGKIVCVAMPRIPDGAGAT